MKKVLLVLLSLVLSLTVFACGVEGKNGDGKKDGIYFEKESVSVLSGRTDYLVVKAEENFSGSTEELEWTSSDETILTVKDATMPNLMSGEIKALKEGTVTVTATASNGKKATAQVKVLVKLTANANTVTVMQGETANFPIGSVEGLTFESKKESIATVDSTTGVITGVAEGETTIVASNELSSCEVTVVVKKLTLPLLTNTMSIIKNEATAFPLDDITGVTFSVADATILSIDSEGKMTGLKKGTTTVTATKGSLSAQLSVSVIESRDASVTLSATIDERFAFYGRTNFVAGKGQSFYYGASGFDISFYGTFLKAEISASTTAKGNNMLSVFVDGESMTNRSAEGNRVITINSTTAKTYTLVSGLEEGWHTIKVRKRTPYQSGDNVFGYVSLKSVNTDGYIGEAPRKSDFRIDFYGDSITNGYGNLTDGATENVSNTDTNMTYASILANKLGVSHNIVSASGWGIVWRNSGASGYAIPDFYDKLHVKSPIATGSVENYSASGASVIVINLGTNDASAISNHGKTIAEFKEKYIAFLNNLRSANPNAHIFCTYGMMGTNASVMNAINEVVVALGDSKIYAHNLTKTSTAGHPLVSGHQQSALELETLLRNKGIIS